MSNRRKKIRLCVNTQTPVVRFKRTYSGLLNYNSYDAPRTRSIRLDDLVEGTDYQFSPGGVTAMVYPLVRLMQDRGMIENVRWISLGAGAPREVRIDDITMCNVSLDKGQLSAYTNFKEGIWNEIHSLGTLSLRAEEYEAYALYNWISAKLMLEMLNDVDVFWIHDFQQLLIGNLIGPSAPAILRWHVPLRLDGLSERLRTLVLKSMEGFDSIIVSTRRELEGLIHAGYRGRARAIYPYVQPAGWGAPSLSSIESTTSRLGLKPQDRPILVVARMDPIKSQDLTIRALSHLKTDFPEAKLVLVGNGSFTGSQDGGLGHPKSSEWRSALQTLVESLSLKDRVIFAGHVSHDELCSLYSSAEVVVVPSRVEGFNLTAVEGWLYKKPCVVSRGAGVSELVQNGFNGFVFNINDDADLAERLRLTLSSSESASKMGENGSITARLCDVNNAADALQEIFEGEARRYAV